MSVINPTELLSILEFSSPFLIFFLMFIEGPIVTYATAFLSSQGIFNIYLIFILSIFGNIIPDTFLFLFGRYGRTKSIEKIIHFFGLTPLKINRMERRFHNHAGKSIILSKLIPGLAIPGIILAGFSKIPPRKFFFISLSFNISSAIFFTLFGYYSGITISKFLKYLNWGKYILIILFVNVLVIYLLIKLINKFILTDKKNIL